MLIAADLLLADILAGFCEHLGGLPLGGYLGSVYMSPFVTLDIPIGKRKGLEIRLVRSWDAVRNEWRIRIGPVCECGQMIPYFVQIQPMDTNWETHEDDDDDDD